MSTTPAQDRPVKPFVERVHTKIKLSDKKMKPYLAHSKSLIKRYTGPYFWSKTESQEIPTGERNVLPGFFSYINSVLPYLATQNPAVRIASKSVDYRFFAEKYEGGANHMLEEINFVKSLQRMVLDSMFGFGLCKTGIADNHDDTSPEGFLHDPQQFYADRIDPKDFVWDTNAPTWEKAFFLGNRFSWPVDFCESLAADGILDPEAVRALIDEQAGKSDDEPNSETNADRLDPQLKLIEIWEPRSNRLKIISDTESKPLVLSDEAYEGPERGPYVLLGYHFVPGNLLPLPPLSLLKELDEMNNELGRATHNRVKTGKDVVMVEEDVDDDTVDAVRTGRDGEYVRVPVGTITGNKFQQISLTGVSSEMLAHAIWIQDQMNIAGANFKTLGGTQASAKTATQDQQLLQQASHTINAMQGKVREFTKEIVEKLAWYLWKRTDAIPLTQSIAGKMVDMPFDPALKEGDFLDYVFDIEPYSAAGKDPQRLFADTKELFRDIMIPTLPVAMEQGDAPSIREMVRILADYLDIDVDDVYRHIVPANQAGQPTNTATDEAAGGGQPRPQGQAAPTEPAGEVA